MKRVFLITFIFIILHSVSAFCSLTVDDYKRMEIEGIEPTYNQITQDQTSYENFLTYVEQKTDSHYTMPSFSDVATLTENLLAYSVGNYADVASGVFSNLADTFSLGSDIWDFMTFNVQQMAFDYLPDFVSLMREGVDDEIYITPSGGSIGNWQPLPVYNVVLYPWTSINNQFTNVEGNSCYITAIPNGYCLAYKGTIVSGFNVRRDGAGGYQYYTCNEFYQGSLDSGYFVATYGTAVVSGLNGYSDVSTALVDFFGNDSSAVPVLTDAIIVNENPVINPVSLTSALGYPFKETIINNYNNNTPIPWRSNIYTYVDYNYNYEVPFWEGQQLETLEYPSEIEFPTIEFETIEVDQSVDTALEGLNGSWIVEFFLVAILLLILGLIL